MFLPLLSNGCLTVKQLRLLSKQAPDNGCVVKDNDGVDFDLSRLQKATGNYVVSGGEHWYELNVCAPLNGPRAVGCNATGTAVCQSDLTNATFIDAGEWVHRGLWRTTWHVATCSRSDSDQLDSVA